MRRACIAVVAALMLIGCTVPARAGGHHQGSSSSFWWGVGTGAALGVIGGLAVPRYPYPTYPAPYPGYPGYPYPPVVVAPPPTRTLLYCYNPPGYYPHVPWCPQWVLVPGQLW